MRIQARTVAFLSVLAEPLGAIFGLVVVALHLSFNALFMAVAGGAMIFVSLHELLPMAKRYGKIRMFVMGAVSNIFVYALLATALPE